MRVVAPYAVPTPERAEFFATREQATLYAASIGGQVYKRKYIKDDLAYYVRAGQPSGHPQAVFGLVYVEHKPRRKSRPASWRVSTMPGREISDGRRTVQVCDG